VDDIILVGIAQKREDKMFKKVLRDCEKASHQRINIQKTRIFFVNTPTSKQRKITNIFGCMIDQLPTK